MHLNFVSKGVCKNIAYNKREKKKRGSWIGSRSKGTRRAGKSIICHL